MVRLKLSGRTSHLFDFFQNSGLSRFPLPFVTSLTWSIFRRSRSWKRYGGSLRVSFGSVLPHVGVRLPFPRDYSLNRSLESYREVTVTFCSGRPPSLVSTLRRQFSPRLSSDVVVVYPTEGFRFVSSKRSCRS